MKTKVLFLTLSVLITTAVPVLAKTTWFGAQGGSVLPTGDLEVITTSGGGGALHLDQVLSQSFQVRVGASDEDTFFAAAVCAGLLIPVSAHGGMLEINASYDLWFDETDTAGRDLDMGLVRLGVGYRFNI